MNEMPLYNTIEYGLAKHKASVLNSRIWERLFDLVPSNEAGGISKRVLFYRYLVNVLGGVWEAHEYVKSCSDYELEMMYLQAVLSGDIR